MFDNATLGSAGSSPLTFSHTCTGTGLILSVGVVHNGTTTISGITYNGVAMTQINNQRSGDTDNDLWYLLNPATGVHNVVVTTVGAVTVLNAAAASYSSMKQTGQPDGQVTSGSTTPCTNIITSTANNCIHVAFVSDPSQAIAAGASTFLRTTAGQSYGFFDNGSGIIPAGSNTITFTNSSQAMQANGATFISNLFSIAPSDTSGAPTESITITAGAVITASDTAGAPTESGKAKIGFSDQSKSSSTWTNQQKS